MTQLTSSQATDIGDKGTRALAAALKSNATLTTINLKSKCTWPESHSPDTDIGDEGAKALAEALISHATLTHLNLESKCK